MSFAGTHTALVTPFKDGAFDREAFESLIESQISGGVEGIVPVGTTGESPTLSHEEHSEVIETAIGRAKGSCRVIAGTGSNSTAEAWRGCRSPGRSLLQQTVAGRGISPLSCDRWRCGTTDHPL